MEPYARYAAVLFAAVVATSAACAPPAPEEGAADDSSAMKAGSRFTSSLRAGQYDSADAILYVGSQLDRQVLTLTSTGDGKVVSCSGTADVEGGKVTVVDDENGCAFEATADGDDVVVKGTLAGTYRARAAGAVEGVYRGGEMTLTVHELEPTSSRIRVSVTVGASTWDGELAARQVRPTFHIGELGACEQAYVTLARERAAYVFHVWGNPERPGCGGLEGHGSLRRE